MFLNIHRSGVLTALAWLVPQESAARESQSLRVLCTPYNHAPCHFVQSHIRKVYACLAVTRHLRFWQDDRGLLRATAVTRGWNGYQNADNGTGTLYIIILSMSMSACLAETCHSISVHVCLFGRNSVSMSACLAETCHSISVHVCLFGRNLP